MTNIKFIALAAVCIILSMITSTYAASTVLRSRQIGTGATNTYVAVTDGTDTIWTDPTTLPGGAPPGNDTEIPYNDSGAWAAEAAFTYQTGTNTMGVDSINVTTLNTSALTVQNDADITGDAVITGVAYITEQAAASGDTAGDGQVWVKDDTPNELWFTDDAGTDYQLTPLVIDTDTNVVVI
ncbi:hypothetical protein KAR91_32795, partial [Candidatus Pacearchaeota archaeon]|nr:hypothetical protein [Candidatus Pacearchaeota archaeon]